MTPLDGLSLALDTVGDLIDASPIEPAALARPTPCRSYDVAALADHVRDTHLLLINAAAETHVESDRALAEIHRDLAENAVKAWNVRGVDGTVDLAGNEVPAGFALALHTVETVVHGWDLGRALDRAFLPAQDLVDHVWSLLPLVVSDQARGTQEGAAYLPAVPVPNDAPLLDQVIAFTGRTPAWTPDPGSAPTEDR